MQIIRSRRDFLTTLSAAGAASVLRARSASADEGPPETTTLRLSTYPNICLAPGFIADELLLAEGFTDIRPTPNTPLDSVARGETDFEFDIAAWLVAHLDAGQPVTALAGVHSGCYELFANEPIETIRDLKGRKVGIDRPGSGAHLLLAIMAAQGGSTLTRTSSGSPVSTVASRDCSPKGSSMRFSPSPPSRRNCARARSVA